METKKFIGRLSLAALVMTAAASCDENSWNNHLDGFEEFDDQPITQVETVDFTLPESVYGTVASLAANQDLAGEEGAAALEAVGKLKRFSADAPASKYLPAYLNTSTFPYFTLSDGSAVKVTYNVAMDEPEGYAEASHPQTYSISSEQYELDVWGSDDWIDAFAPSMDPADYIPGFLSDYIDVSKGNYVVVSYRMATQEPVFGGGDTTAPVEPEVIFAESFTESLGDFTVDNVNLPSELEFIWSWGGANYGAKASAFKGQSYASESWLVSPVVDMTAYTTATMTFEHVVNKFPDAEFARANCTMWAKEAGAASWTQVTIPEYTDNTSWTFGASGAIDLAAYAGKKMQFAFKYVSETDKSGTWEIKNLSIEGLRGSRAQVKASVPTETVNALYAYTGGEWAPAKGFCVLSPADYTAMGQNYPNLSTAEPYLSRYLAIKYPYAKTDDVMCVVWNRYAGGSAAYTCSAYVFDGSQWVADNFIGTETSQFVRTQGKWIFDPNVTINLPAGKGQELSTLYFQTATNWVFDNICKPLGDTNIKSGLFYVTSYGNNEYYSGCSAYQGNVDLRAQSAYAQYPAGYEGMSDDEIVALMKKRFMEEVMPGTLAILHPDADLLPGFDVLYTVNFSAYYADRTTRAHTAIFKVVAKGKFEPVSCTWDE